MKKFFLASALALLTGFVFMPVTLFAVEPIQVQQSSSGTFEAFVIEAKIKKDVLTIKIGIKNISPKKKTADVIYAEVYYIDIKNKKKYFILKDEEGVRIAGPKFTSAAFHYKIEPEKQKILWMKFPVPPEETKMIDIFLPGFMPFEDINLSR
jgi:hypothetical protein